MFSSLDLLYAQHLLYYQLHSQPRQTIPRHIYLVARNVLGNTPPPPRTYNNDAPGSAVPLSLSLTPISSREFFPQVLL